MGRTHPLTGKSALYVNRGFTRHIIGIPARRERRMLNYLYQHCENPLSQCNFCWTKNAIAFNGGDQHRAMWDAWSVLLSKLFRIFLCSVGCPTCDAINRAVFLFLREFRFGIVPLSLKRFAARAEKAFLSLVISKKSFGVAILKRRKCSSEFGQKI
jgi:Taurine catabolism dioxygenase TauD, TfdA family